MDNFVVYYRVSTQKQGRSGLGLEAQKAATEDYISRAGGQLLESFTDIETGKKDNRPNLEKALRKCRLTGATLLIAKLDRLSRNAAFLMHLEQATWLKFTCVDMPEANSFTIGIMACMAQYERELISQRTKSALKAAKARGTVLGNPVLHLVRNTNPAAASKAWQQQTQQRQVEIKEVCQELITEHGDMSFRALAERLNSTGYKTKTGKAWQGTQVWRIMKAA